MEINHKVQIQVLTPLIHLRGEKGAYSSLSTEEMWDFSH